MQFIAQARVVNDSQTVLLLFEAAVVHTGTFESGEALTFSGGGTGICTSYSPGVLKYVVTGDIKPFPGEDVTGLVSAVTTALSSLEQDPDLNDFSVNAGDFFIRDAGPVGYAVASVPRPWKLVLAADYIGSTELEADIVVHTDRTSLGLHLYDHRDRNQALLRSEDARKLDAYLTNIIARLDALEADMLGLRFTFDTATSDSDPGTGKLKLNNADQSAATFIYASETDGLGSNVEATLLSIDDSTSSVPATIWLCDRDNPSKALICNVTGDVVNSVNYVKIPIVVVGELGGADPLTDDADLDAAWTRTGDVGASIGPAGADGSRTYVDTGAPSSGLGSEGDFYVDSTARTFYWKTGSPLAWATLFTVTDGATGDPGDDGADGNDGADGETGPATGALTFVFSTSTTVGDPGNGFIRLNHADQNFASRLVIDDQDFNSSDIQPWLRAWNDLRGDPARGVVWLQRTASPQQGHVFRVVRVLEQNGYFEVEVENILEFGTTNPLQNGEEVLLTFVYGGSFFSLTEQPYKTIDYDVQKSDSGKVLVADKTVPITFQFPSVEELGADFVCVVFNRNVGGLQLVASTSPQELINGAASIPIKSFASAMIWTGNGELHAHVSATSNATKTEDTPTDYGAVGDGNTDDTAAFQMAFDAATNPGGVGKVVVLPGDYVVTNWTLDEAVHVELRPGAAIILDDGADDNVVYVTADNVKFTGLGLIDGNRANQSTGEGVSDGIRIQGADNVVVDGPTITGCVNNGIIMLDTNGSKIENVKVFETGQTGAFFRSTLNTSVEYDGPTIEKCYVDRTDDADNDEKCIAIQRDNSSNVIRGTRIAKNKCFMHDTPTGLNVLGIEVFSSNGYGVFDTVVEGNHVTGSDIGISIAARCSGFTVVGNTVRNADGIGIEIADSRRGTVSGNTVDGEESTVLGISIDGTNHPCASVTATGNSINYTTTTGIRPFKDTPACVVSNNTITITQGFGISCHGADDVDVTGNTVDGSGTSDSALVILLANDINVSGNKLKNTANFGVQILASSGNVDNARINDDNQIYDNTNGMIQAIESGGGLISQAYFGPFDWHAPDFTANQDDYHGGDSAWYRNWLVTTDATRSLTGIARGYARREVLIYNRGTNNLTIPHLSGSSSAANQFITPSGSTLTVGPRQSVLAQYDNLASKWRVIYAS